MFKRFNNFYSPESVSGAPAGEMGKEEIIEFLNADDDPDDKPLPLDDKLPKGKDKDKDDDKEEVENKDDGEEITIEDEIEKELDGPKDEDLDLVTPVRRKEILAKYPTLFKDFPYLEKAYYREQAYTEILPTLDDAKEAVTKAETLDSFETELMDGKTETILKAVKSQDSKAFNKIVDDYLPALARVDEQAYHHVIGNTIKHTIIAMINEAKTSQNETLQSAAQILNQFVFGSSNFQSPTNLVNTDDKSDKKDTSVSDERQKFIEERLETSRDDLNTRVSNTLKATIEANIDPKESMTPYVKKNASREALESLDKAINEDKRFATIIDRLWQNAADKNFNKDSLDKIRSAYLSKAKTLLPTVIKGARNEALKGIGKRVKEDEEVDRKGLLSQRRSTTSNNSNESGRKSPKDIPASMKSIDYLMQD